MIKPVVAFGASLALGLGSVGCSSHETIAASPEFHPKASSPATQYDAGCGVWQSVNPIGREDYGVSPLLLPLNTVQSKTEVAITVQSTYTAQAAVRFEYDPRLDHSTVGAQIETVTYRQDTEGHRISMRLGGFTIRVSEQCLHAHGDYAATLDGKQRLVKYDGYSLPVDIE